eukprot:344807-Hanusia_phi.AAC.1
MQQREDEWVIGGRGGRAERESRAGREGEQAPLREGSTRKARLAKLVVEVATDTSILSFEADQRGNSQGTSVLMTSWSQNKGD